MDSNPCQVCGTTDDDKPMCFRKTRWCSDDHRKILVGELPPLDKKASA